MKLLLALAIPLSALMQIQSNPQETPDLIVTKFSIGTYERGGSMVRSVHDPDEGGNHPIRIAPPPPRNEPQEVQNRRDMAERRAELRTADINAHLSSQPGRGKIYYYRLQFKNGGTKVVKSFAWEYQPTAESDPSNRQFFCVVKTKPNESKELELFTSLTPSRVVDAADAANKSEQNSKGRVIINKIEFVDGSVWVRGGWNPATFSGDVTQKIEAGKCVGL